MEFRDLKGQYKQLKSEIDNAVQEVLKEGNFISGHQVDELEQSLAEYVGTKHCVTCANGTDALSMMMMAWGIKKGDAVFVPDFTFFSSGEIVSFAGATPVFYDVSRETYNADVLSLEKVIKKVIAEGKLIPKVILAVDLFGLPADYLEIEKIAKKYGMYVLEDGAQGFGGKINGQMACSFGDAATTSFFPAKPLGCYGDGGAIFTNNDKVAEYLKSIRVHGKGDFKYDNVRIGRNSRLDTLQAAILNVKLKAFKEYEVRAVNVIASWYSEYLKEQVQIPVIPQGYFSSWAQYTIQLDNERMRNGVQAFLKEKGIPTMVYYPKPMHMQTAFASIDKYSECKNTERLCNTVLSLPMHPYLKREECEKVCNYIKIYLENCQS